MLPVICANVRNYIFLLNTSKVSVVHWFGASKPQIDGLVKGTTGSTQGLKNE